jgi:hypothetical protein
MQNPDRRRQCKPEAGRRRPPANVSRRSLCVAFRQLPTQAEKMVAIGRCGAPTSNSAAAAQWRARIGFECRLGCDLKWICSLGPIPVDEQKLWPAADSFGSSGRFLLAPFARATAAASVVVVVVAGSRRESAESGAAIVRLNIRMCRTGNKSVPYGLLWVELCATCAPVALDWILVRSRSGSGWRCASHWAANGGCSKRRQISLRQQAMPAPSSLPRAWLPACGGRSNGHFFFALAAASPGNRSQQGRRAGTKDNDDDDDATEADEVKATTGARVKRRRRL